MFPIIYRMCNKIHISWLLHSSGCGGVGGGVSSECIGGSVGSRGISGKGISLPQLAFLVGIGLMFGKQWALVWHWPQPHR